MRGGMFNNRGGASRGRGGFRGKSTSPARRGNKDFNNNNPRRGQSSFGNRSRGSPSPRRDRGGPKRSGLQAGNKVIIVPFESGKKIFEGIYVARGKADAIVTKNMSPGVSVYGEKRVEVMNETGDKIEYRVWNAFRSKLGAAIISGISSMPISPGKKVLYLGAASGTTVSHVSDIVGPEGTVYAVEFSHRSGRDLTETARRRPNIVPIIDDARMPWKYRMLVPMVDVIFADVAQPDQSRIVALNASYFLKEDGDFIISIKANCVDSSASPEAVYAAEIDALKKEKCKAKEQLGLEPYHRDHALVMGKYRPSASNKN